MSFRTIVRNLFPPCYQLVTRVKISPFGRDDSKSGVTHVLNYKFAVLIKIPRVPVILLLCSAVLSISNAYSYEAVLEADIDVRAEYNDNIFLTSQPHDSTKAIMITPSLHGIIKEEHWQAQLNAMIRSENYSDDSFDGNEQFFSLTGQYREERNILSLNVTHDFASNLSSASTDFGIAGRRINTKRQSITPQYTRLITERLVLTLSYAYTDVDFENAENTSYTPYITETGSASLMYDLTERDKLTFSLQGVDYTSKNDLITYRLFTSRIGLDHKFSERLSANFLVGISRVNSTNLTTQIFDFFGQPVTVTQEIDSKRRGSVYNVGLTQLLESGEITGRIGRNFNSNSFGGLDRTDQLTVNYLKKLSELWRYAINGRIDDISSKNTGGDLSRKVFFFESVAYYSISKNWNVNASYRYVLRRFNSDTSDDRAPHSNRIYVGLTYNFPSLSTF